MNRPPNQKQDNRVQFTTRWIYYQ